MPQLSQDRILRKEVSLGLIREIEPPQTHVGLAQIAPWLPVQSDDVIFGYAAPEVDGLAPARAEDAESELAQKDETVGTGRASIIDWAIKDHYDPSDVSRYREFTALAELAAGGGDFPLSINNMTEGFQARLARDARRRRRRLDNRFEWLIWQALETGQIAYNDGKIKFTVSFGRPGGQTDAAPASGVLWSQTTSDPIGDALAVKEFMRNTYGVTMGRAYASERVINAIINSERFAARAGIASVGTGIPIDPNYVIDGWGTAAARAVFERQTGIELREYDAVYRTRALGSTTTVNNRFFSDNKIVFLPSTADIDELSDTEIGFAATLTSPHPEGNWASGFYEWERSTVDPWGQDMGTGCKGFPIFPHLDLTYSLAVL